MLIIYLHDIEPLAEHIIVHYRFIFVMFLLPVSFLYDIWFYTRNKIVFAMSSAPTKHKEKVLGIQRQVNSCNIFTSRTETKIFKKTLKTKNIKKDISKYDFEVLSKYHSVFGPYTTNMKNFNILLSKMTFR